MLKKQLFASAVRLAVVFAVFTLALVPAFAQEPANTDQTAVQSVKNRAFAAIRANDYEVAVTMLVDLVKRVPDDGEARLLLSLALIGKSKTTNDAEVGKLLAAQAFTEVKKAKELGLSKELAPLADAIIRIFSGEADGGNGGFSKNADANKLMAQAEAAFARSDYDRAFEFYQKALALDPTIYEAALYSGDAMAQKGDLEAGEKWYQQAIKINPERETAYRYSATSLMKLKKFELARDRYVEAFITEPYNERAIGGLVQWARATGVTVGHPRFSIPTFKTGTDGESRNSDSVRSLGGGPVAWLSYTKTRTKWYETKFKATFPNEKTYRHSLQEEVEALKSVVDLAGELKSKTPDPELETLKKLSDEGLLESFVLLAIADEDLQAEHLAYLRQNREKLRRYVTEYVISK